ncbi:MAG: hypothetical protein C0471_04035 [Erythrobacter sp.]|nr:hypothetical protein [Erythrobacter sp.]
MSGEDIRPGSPLARVLDDYPVPPLSAGFADRVMAAAEARAPALPPLRRTAAVRGWRTGRRFAIAMVSFGALATAAAATGVLERVGLPVPSAETVWANLTGGEAPATAAPAPAKPAVATAAAPFTPVVIEGPIDTPEELSEAFRRIDEVRQGRSEARRQLVDQRIDRAIERRQAAGLPVPDAEQEARLRQRIDDLLAQREARAGERIEARREELRQRVDNGEALTRESIVPNRQAGVGLLPGGKRIRDLSPQERRELLRSLPPEQRRALTEEYRKWRDQRALPTAGSDLPVTPTESSPEMLDTPGDGVENPPR